MLLMMTILEGRACVWRMYFKPFEVEVPRFTKIINK